MKQYLLQFSALLIILLVGTASAIEDTGNSDSSLVTYTGANCSITYDCGGFVKTGDVVTITATFNEPIYDARAIVDDNDDFLLTPNEPDWSNSTKANTTWTFTYDVPAGIDNAVDVTVYGISIHGLIEETDVAAFVIDNEKPIFKWIEPSCDPVFTKCVLFEFSAFDRLDNKVDYTIYVNGTKDKCGTISYDGSVTYKPGLAEGRYPLSIVIEDDAGNVATREIDLYVDCKDPSVTPIYPKNLTVVTENPLTFNFTAVDRFCENYSLDMNYQLYIDGEPVDELGFSGVMSSGDYITIPCANLSDGAHEWYALVEDQAKNNCSGKVQNFYVIYNGLDVELISPDGGFVPANPAFNFSVAGGAGLPFEYELLINGTKVKNGTSVIDEDGVCDISVEAAVCDGVNIPWTVKVTDCADEIYQPEPLYFSVDSVAPASVANLTVIDAFSDTTWYYTYDEPGLYVCWDKNTEEDLYDGLEPHFGLPGEEAYYGLPYVVFISDCKPCCVEDMEVAVPYSTIYETEDGKSLFMNIGEFNGEPLVYGKDYWVAVVALDRAGNYDKCFAKCGPVQTYEDMNLALDEGWNLKSIPKRLAKFNADTCSVFGKDSTVIYWNGSCWEFPKTIEPCKGYWVYTPKACENNVKFKPMSIDCTNPDVPPCLDLDCGWQMIGHTSTVPVNWAETLGSMKGPLVDYKFSNLITYSHSEGWGGCSVSLGLIDLLSAEEPEEIPCPVEFLETDGLMVPGQGYWVFMKEDGTYASVESVDFYNNTA